MPIEIKSNIDIEIYLSKQKSLIDNHLKKIFNDSSYMHPKELWDALRYSLLDGGKRIRGILCLATNESLSNVAFEDCLTTACSIELIHAMSLIHDDLPCMDNDDIRRGKLSCHKAFSESTAILTGDAMLSLAFQLICEQTKEIRENQKLKIINNLSQAFSFGLVPGQILDLSANEENHNLNFIKNVACLKTAELFKASVVCGGIISLGDDMTNIILEALSTYGLNIGIAFQIIDDILDITSDTKTPSTTSPNNEKQKKATFPLVLGIEKSKKMACELITKAKSELQKIKMKTQLLNLLADHMINRIN